MICVPTKSPCTSHWQFDPRVYVNSQDNLRRSLLHKQSIDDTLNLSDIEPFMVCQPLGIGPYGSFAWLACPRYRRYSSPGFGRQRLQHPQQFGTLSCKSSQRGMKSLFKIIRLLDPGRGIDSLERGRSSLRINAMYPPHMSAQARR